VASVQLGVRSGHMARECFCGCGRTLGFRDRSLSRRAAKIEAAADFLEEHNDPTLEPSDHHEGRLWAWATTRTSFEQRRLDAGKPRRNGLGPTGALNDDGLVKLWRCSSHKSAVGVCVSAAADPVGHRATAEL
jgi:hypothetical protein